MLDALRPYNNGTDSCIVCDQPTQSHSIPHATVCHSCWTNHAVDDLLEEGPVPPLSDPSPETVIRCAVCGHNHELKHAAKHATHSPGLITDRAEILGGFDALLLVFCPACEMPTHYLAESQDIHQVAERLPDPILELRI